MKNAILSVSLLVLIGCQSSVPTYPAIATHRPNYPRSDFAKLVMGKTIGEVRASLGRPDRTFDHTSDGSGLLIWVYSRITADSETGRIDAETWVDFRNSVATEINYSTN